MKKITFLILALLVNIAFIDAQELALVRENDQIAYINKSGEKVITTDFEKAGSFSEGFAAVMQNKKWGFIDKTGNIVIQLTYDKVKRFKSGFALVLNDDQWNYIDKSGKVLNTPVKDKYYDFNEDGVAFYRIEKKMGLMDTQGKVFLEPKYDAIKPFVDGYARVKNGDYWGMINKYGDVAIPVEYTAIGNYHSEAIWARKGESFGLISNGKFNIVSGAVKIWNFTKDSNLTYARKDDKMGYINPKGEWVIQPSFRKARPFKNGLAPVMKEKLWGYVNEKGEEIIEFTFREAEVFSSNGLAAVLEKKLWGFIDKTGKMVIPTQFHIIANYNLPFGVLRGFAMFSNIYKGKGFKDGLARVKYKKEWAFITKDGQPLGGKWYQNAENFSK